MRLSLICRRESVLVGGHVVVSLIGFAVDAVLLTTSLGSGLHAPVARLISLFCAMQTTFVLNGLFVFRTLTLKGLPHQWARYMACNGAGNLVNYLLFVGLLATRSPVVSNHYVALSIAAATAWAINYSGARLWTFSRRPMWRARRLAVDRCEQVAISPGLGPEVLRRRVHLGPEMGGGMPGPARVVEQASGQGHEIGIAGP